MAKKKVVQFRKDLPSTWEEALQQYLWFKQAEGLREVTIRGERDVIRLFYKRHPDAWGQINPKMPIYEFMAEKIMPATYNIHRNYLRQYFNWGIKEGLFTGNPMDGL